MGTRVIVGPYQMLARRIIYRRKSRLVSIFDTFASECGYICLHNINLNTHFPTHSKITVFNKILVENVEESTTEKCTQI